jgi:hypothetical protein
LQRGKISVRKVYLFVSAVLVAGVPSAILLREMTSHDDVDALQLSCSISAKLAFTIIGLVWGFYGVILPLAEEDYSNRQKGRLRSRWSSVAATGVAALTTLHFTFGAFLWVYFSAKGVFEAVWAWRYAWPCFALLVLSLLTLAAAIRRRRSVVTLILLTLILSAFAFWYDVSHERWQWRISIATTEYWETHRGPPENYLTWWWYGCEGPFR